MKKIFGRVQIIGFELTKKNDRANIKLIDYECEDGYFYSEVSLEEVKQFELKEIAYLYREDSDQNTHLLMKTSKEITEIADVAFDYTKSLMGNKWNTAQYIELLRRLHEFELNKKEITNG